MADEFFPGVNVGNPAGYIKGLLDAGENATAGLDIFRADGGHIRTQTWYQLYGEVNDSIQRAGAAAALDPYQLPDPAAYGTWSMGRGGQYATQVKILFTDRDSGVVGTTQYTYITDSPHTPAEAEQAANDMFATDENEQNYRQTVQGTITTNVYQTVPWQRS